MEMTKQLYALRFNAEFRSVSGLMLRSGRIGEFTDSAVETTSDKSLHINGYVWASLLRRTLSRCQEGQQLAKEFGKYKADERGVAPLWTEATFLAESDYITAVNPGNRINRKWGTTDDRALYSDELAYPLIPFTMRGTVFFSNMEKAAEAAELLCAALHIIGLGIETIGGGWSYGFGRLQALGANWAILDLTNGSQRQELWQPEFSAWQKTLTSSDLAELKPEIAKDRGWRQIDVEASISDGQLLAIHSDVPELGVSMRADLPDSFIFTRPNIKDGRPVAVPVITGKSFRQAIISREIERMLRSSGESVCLNSSDPKRQASIPSAKQGRYCQCKRCLWFGDTDARGIISVADAQVRDWDCDVVHRIQLCEHSMQNSQLFNGEYLTRGSFTLRVIIDHSRGETNPQELTELLPTILNQMLPDGGPPGWYRLGATSTCTGQLSLKGITISEYNGKEDSCDC